MNPDKCIFICYSHSDRVVVEADIKWLETQNIDVWYDELILGGTDWSDELAHQIEKCSHFLYFVSPKSVESIHCRNELNYAQQHGRQIIAVEIAPVQVPPGIQLTLNNRQQLFRHLLSNHDYNARLLKALENKTPDHVRSLPIVKNLAVAHNRKRAIAALIVTLFAASIFYVLSPSRLATDFNFEARDWIVVGHFENGTIDPLLSDSLEFSLRIALEQSPFANVMPGSMVRAANQRMKRDPEAPLDKEAALEVAKREGAKAAIIASIFEIGDSFSLSVELFDAATGGSVWASSANARNLNEVLPAIDNLSQQVRERLGEPLPSIEATSLPLAKVTTPDLEALRAYTLSEKRVASGDKQGGIDLLQRALDIDPEFAMAHGKIAAIYGSNELFPELYERHLQLAKDNSDRLTRREELYIEASAAWRETPDEMLSAWKLMSTLYPDQSVGFNNLGEVIKSQYLDYESAAVEFAIATEKPHPWRYLTFHNLGRSLLALERPEEALANFEIALAMDSNPQEFELADTLIVLGQFEEAEQLLNSPAYLDSPRLRDEAKIGMMTLKASMNEFVAANEIAEELLLKAIDSENANLESLIRAAHVALLEDSLFPELFSNSLVNALAFQHKRLANETTLVPNTILTHLMILARVAVRSGYYELALPSVELIRNKIPNNKFPVDQALLELLEAEILIEQGDAQAAIARAKASIAHAELFQAHVTLEKAYRKTNNEVAAMSELAWIEQHHGLAFAEKIGRFYYGQMFNVIDWGRSSKTIAEL